MTQPKGLYVPLIAPLDSNGEVDYLSFEKLARRAIDAGATGIVVHGTTGEPATLTEDEKTKLVRLGKKICEEQDAHLCVGAGTNSTAATIDNVKNAQSLGADSVLVVTPYYTRPSGAGIVAHFEALAAATSIDIIAYNIPYRTGRGLNSEGLLKLSKIEGVVGVKQAVGGIDFDTCQVLSGTDQDFSLLCGDDSFIYPLMVLGGRGAIAASSNVFPEAFAAMINYAADGEYEKANRIHQVLLPLTQILFAEPSPSVMKGVLHLQGCISSSSLRLPMTPCSPAIMDQAMLVLDIAQKQFSDL